MTVSTLFLYGWPVLGIGLLALFGFRLWGCLPLLYFGAVGLWAASFRWLSDLDLPVGLGALAQKQGLPLPVATGLVYGALKLSAAQTTLSLGTAALGVWSIRQISATWPRRVIYAITICISFALFLAPDPTMQVPVFGNPSMAGSFLAVVACVTPIFYTMPLLLLVLWTGASTPLAALAAGLAIRLGLRLPRRARLYYLATLLVAGVAILLRGVDTNGRWEVWKQAGRYVEPHYWLGAGAGSTPVLLPLIQAQNPGLSIDGDGFFMFLHNDWAQIFFEYGFVGAVIAWGVFVLLMNRATDRLLPPLIAYAVVMLGNFPLHSPLHALLGIVLVAAIARRSW